MSCQIRFPLCAAALALCFGLWSIPAEAAEVDAGEIYCFRTADFAREESALAGICVTGLPEKGRLLLGTRTIRSGDILTADQLEKLTYTPESSEEDDTAAMRYLPIFSDGVAEEAVVTISVWGKTDDAPAAEDSAIETYKNLPNEGLLKVRDPEGQQLVYTITRAPRRGSLIIREDGSYLYTPEKNKVGTDSFCFTATDPAGNVSREATVTVRILKPADELLYTDTAGLPCRFSAEWMRNTGIFSGESVSGQFCFSPDRSVTRGQFLVMLMDTLGLPVESSVEDTGFLDEAPQWLKPYLAAALRSGLISGYPCEGGIEFRHDNPITGDEAAVMVQNVLNLAVPTAVEEDGAIAAWAAETAAANGSVALTLPQGDTPVTRGDTAVLLYGISKLCTSAPGLSVILRK